MRCFELPWNGPHPRLRTAATALLLVGIGAVLVRLSWRSFTPELLLLLVVALALVLARPGAREPEQPSSADWRPWRGPHPVRNALALVSLGMAGVVLVARPAFERRGEAGEATASLLLTALLGASAVLPPHRSAWFRWLTRLGWGYLTAWSAWQLVQALAR
jgi:hypothetical protein